MRSKPVTHLWVGGSKSSESEGKQASESSISTHQRPIMHEDGATPWRDRYAVSAAPSSASPSAAPAEIA